MGITRLQGTCPPALREQRVPAPRFTLERLTGWTGHRHRRLGEQLSCPRQGRWGRGPGEGPTWALGQASEIGPEPGVGTVLGGRFLGSQQTSISCGPQGSASAGLGGHSSPLGALDLAPGVCVGCTQGTRAWDGDLHLRPRHKCTGRKPPEKSVSRDCPITTPAVGEAGAVSGAAAGTPSPRPSAGRPPGRRGAGSACSARAPCGCSSPRRSAAWNSERAHGRSLTSRRGCGPRGGPRGGRCTCAANGCPP